MKTGDVGLPHSANVPVLLLSVEAAFSDPASTGAGVAEASICDPPSGLVRILNASLSLILNLFPLDASLLASSEDPVGLLALFTVRSRRSAAIRSSGVASCIRRMLSVC